MRLLSAMKSVLDLHGPQGDQLKNAIFLSETSNLLNNYGASQGRELLKVRSPTGPQNNPQTCLRFISHHIFTAT